MSQLESEEVFFGSCFPFLDAFVFESILDCDDCAAVAKGCEQDAVCSADDAEEDVGLFSHKSTGLAAYNSGSLYFRVGRICLLSSLVEFFRFDHVFHARDDSDCDRGVHNEYKIKYVDIIK